MTPSTLLPDFGGTVRLFPLPNLVLFPHVGQPLHIFEPRYRQLMADALDDDRLITLALLKPGWEEDYHLKPPIYPVVCIGRIHNEEKLSDGRYNLMLQGVMRARVTEEIKTSKQYRTARVELIPEEPVASQDEAHLREQLRAGVTPYFSAHPPAAAQFRELLASGLPLGTLSDIFSFVVPLEPEQRQLLLEEPCVSDRIALLLTLLDNKTPPVTDAPPRRRFPPEFSEN